MTSWTDVNNECLNYNQYFFLILHLLFCNIEHRTLKHRLCHCTLSFVMLHMIYLYILLKGICLYSIFNVVIIYFTGYEVRQHAVSCSSCLFDIYISKVFSMNQQVDVFLLINRQNLYS